MQTWILYALLSAFFAALTAIFGKLGLKSMDSDLATAIRTFFVLVITWGFVFFRSKTEGIFFLSRQNWVMLLLSAITTGLSWLFYYRAMQMGKVSEVNIVDKTSMVITLILAFIFLKEPLTVRIIVSAGLIFAGMVVMVWK
jgi:transporter family protein